MRALAKLVTRLSVGCPDCIDAGHGICPGDHRGHRQRHVGRGAAWRHRRSVEPGADREGALGRHRRYRQYQIVNLVPGTYAVTFTLPGFNALTRTGVELSGSFAAKIDAELRVGAVEETITVTGETPIVDVQNTRRQRVIDRETHRQHSDQPNGLRLGHADSGVSRGGLTNQDVGGSSSSGTPIGSVSIHGGRTGDQVVMRNGIETIGQSGTGFSTPVNINPVGTQEVNVDTASGGAEYATGGVRINVIPREGGNTFNGAFFTSYASPSWQADNLTQELKDARRPFEGRPPQGQLRHQPGVWRAAQAGSPLVLCVSTLQEFGELRLGHVLRQELQQPERLGVRAGPGADRPPTRRSGRGRSCV